MKNIIFATCLFLFFESNAKTNEIPYTLDDRDRMVRLETKLEEGFKSMDANFDAKLDALQKQIDFTNNLILTLIAGLLGSIIYMWWDRRAANAPLKDAIENEAKKTKNLLKALKEYADSHPDLKTIFDRAAIL